MSNLDKLVRYDLKTKTFSSMLQIEFCQIVDFECFAHRYLAVAIYEKERFVVDCARILILELDASYNCPIGFMYRFDRHLNPITHQSNVKFTVCQSLCPHIRQKLLFSYKNCLIYLNQTRRITFVQKPVLTNKISENEVSISTKMIDKIHVRGKYLYFKEYNNGGNSGCFNLHSKKLLIRYSAYFTSLLNKKYAIFSQDNKVFYKDDLLEVKTQNFQSTLCTLKGYGDWKITGKCIYVKRVNQSWFVVTSEGEVCQLSLKCTRQNWKFKNWKLTGKNV